MAWKKDYNIIGEDDNAQSRINAAGLINSTLEKLWSESYIAMSHGNYLLWNIKLDSIWAILGGDEIEGGDKDKKINKINLEIYNKGSLKSTIGKGFKRADNPNNSVQYLLLLKKSLFLRRLQNKQGKGTAYASSDEDDIN